VKYASLTDQHNYYNFINLQPNSRQS